MSSRNVLFPWYEEPSEILSLHTATMLDTIAMICVKFSFNVGGGVGLRTPDRTLCMAQMIDSVCASRKSYNSQYNSA